MTTVLLVRHGRTTANASGVLAGWSDGVDLDDAGRAQAAALGERLRQVPLAAAVTSPLARCRQTVDAVLQNRPDVPRHADDRLGECRYGDWTGVELKKLAKDPLWPVVQAHPSAAVFPGEDGEPLRHTQARAVDGIRQWNAELGEDATYLVCSHADVIKAIVADALGLHLDLFQRIQVDPASLTVIRYTRLRPFLVRLNDVGGATADLLPPKRRRARRSGSGGADGRGRRATEPRGSDAVVGGGAGAPPERR